MEHPSAAGSQENSESDDADVVLSDGDSIQGGESAVLMGELGSNADFVALSSGGDGGGGDDDGEVSLDGGV